MFLPFFKRGKLLMFLTATPILWHIIIKVYLPEKIMSISPLAKMVACQSWTTR